MNATIRALWERSEAERPDPDPTCTADVHDPSTCDPTVCAEAAYRIAEEEATRTCTHDGRHVPATTR